MEQTRITRRFLLMAATMLVSIGTAYLLYLRASAYPACCDAIQYVDMARHFETSGFNPYAPHADVRTFGYPLFIALVSRATAPFGLSLQAAVFMMQVVLYFGCVISLYRRVSRVSGPVASAAVYYALTLNLLLLPYLALTLTDGFSVILMLASAYLLLGMVSSESQSREMLRAALLGLLLGIAVVVRPANLWFVSLLAVGTTLAWRRHCVPGADQPDAKAIRGAVLFLIVAAVVGVVATLPQTALNWVRAHHASPLPIYDLKAKQVEAGLRNIKYATSMVGRPAGVFYTNPFFTDSDTRAGLRWYFREPLRGLGTIALRMFSAFDFDHFFPYIYDLRPAYRPLLFAFSQFVMFFGLGGVVLLVSPTLARRTLGPSAATDFCWKAPITAGQVFGPMLVAWAAIYSVSAVENRFALPMVTLLMPVAFAAAWALFKLFRSGAVHRGLRVLAAFVIWIAIATSLAGIMERAQQLPPS
jgi:hypothetical protein